jgi:tRNA threonylcarbamoyladenosine biosynthesis protein TsaB
MECVAGCHEVIGRGHAERLVPMIAELPGKGLADIISVNVGPGSFTGIRVGISAAKALALAWNVPCEGYNALALLAAIARDQIGAAPPVDVVIHGGHGELFFQSFDAEGSDTTSARSLAPEQAATMSHAPLVVGDAAPALIGLRGSGSAVEVISDARHWPAIAGMPPLPASAAYIRAPDAKLPGGKK